MFLIAYDVFLFIAAIWCSHDSFWSIIMPKTFMWSFDGMMIVLSPSSTAMSSRLSFPITMTSVLAGFIRRPFEVYHSWTLFTHFSIFFFRMLGFLADTSRTASSAYATILQSVTAFARSAVNAIKGWGRGSIPAEPLTLFRRYLMLYRGNWSPESF